MKKGRYQSKDIPRLPILRFLLNVPTNPTLDFRNSRTADGFHWDLPTRSACSFGEWGSANLFPNSIFNAMPLGTPRRLGISVIRKMIRSGWVEGCACGCRGDFEITDAGKTQFAIGMMQSIWPSKYAIAFR